CPFSTRKPLARNRPEEAPMSRTCATVVLCCLALVFAASSDMPAQEKPPAKPPDKAPDKGKKLEVVEVYQVWWTVKGKMQFYAEAPTRARADEGANALRKFPSKPNVEVRGPIQRKVVAKAAAGQLTPDSVSLPAGNVRTSDFGVSRVYKTDA